MDISRLNGNIEHLKSAFPNKEKPFLKDALQLCDGDLRYTTHVNGRAESYVYSSKTVRTTASTPENLKAGSGARAQQKLEKEPPVARLKPYLSTMIKKEITLEAVAPTPEDSVESMADKLFGCFGGRASTRECEDALRRSNNDLREAFDKLEEKYKLDDDVFEVPRPRTRARRDSGVVGLNEERESLGQNAHAKTSSLIREQSEAPTETALESKKPERYPGGVIPSHKGGNVSKDTLSKFDVMNGPNRDILATEKSKLEHPEAHDLHDILPSATIAECIQVLKHCNGNMEEAFNKLEERGHKLHSPGENNSQVSSSSAPSIRNGTPDEDYEPIPDFASRLRIKKRPLENPFERDNKKTKVAEGTYEEDGLSSDEDEEHARPARARPATTLLPAEEWINETYPEETDVTLLLGPDEDKRATIPMHLLRKNFAFMQKYIDNAPPQGSSKWVIHIPYVPRDSFDLAVQFTVCKDTVVRPPSDDLPQHMIKAEEIKALLKLRYAALDLGFSSKALSDLLYHISFKLRDILKRERLALKGQHIEAVYAEEDMSDSKDIRELFAQASVWFWMHKGEPEDVAMDDDDKLLYEEDEGEHLNAAQQEAGSSSTFPFSRQTKTIPAFKHDLAMEVLKTVATKERVERECHTSSGKKGRKMGWGLTCQDPLTNKPFDLI